MLTTRDCHTQALPMPAALAPAGGHIPYRDSKLTRILQPSLGGNAKTAIICNVTPAACHVEESHSTLRFACRAKRVVNNAMVNEVLSDAAVLKRQAKEIEELRKALGSSGCDSSQFAAVVRCSLILSAPVLGRVTVSSLSLNVTQHQTSKTVCSSLYCNARPEGPYVLDLHVAADAYMCPPSHLCCVPCRNAEVEEQISHLRAQLLRSEQDNELMRIKLEQETAEREKAQKQVCCAIPLAVCLTLA